jgi:hypothetical protein
MMKDATKKAASGALAQILAVTAMLVIASVIFYVRWRGEGDGAGWEDWTPDLRFTKPLLYRWAKPAEYRGDAGNGVRVFRDLAGDRARASVYGGLRAAVNTWGEG